MHRRSLTTFLGFALLGLCGCSNDVGDGEPSPSPTTISSQLVPACEPEDGSIPRGAPGPALIAPMNDGSGETVTIC